MIKHYTWAKDILPELINYIAEELGHCGDLSFDTDADHHEFTLGMCRAYNNMLNLLTTVYAIEPKTEQPNV